jgi:hypothetical protein
MSKPMVPAGRAATPAASMMIAMALLLVACGNDKDGNTTGGTGGSTAGAGGRGGSTGSGGSGIMVTGGTGAAGTGVSTGGSGAGGTGTGGTGTAGTGAGGTGAGGTGAGGTGAGGTGGAPTGMAVVKLCNPLSLANMVPVELSLQIGTQKLTATSNTCTPAVKQPCIAVPAGDAMVQLLRGTMVLESGAAPIMAGTEIIIFADLDAMQMPTLSAATIDTTMGKCADLDFNDIFSDPPDGGTTPPPDGGA